MGDLVSRSGSGRFRQFQRVTRQRPPRAPQAVFGGVSYLETFPTNGDVEAGQDLTWNSIPPEVTVVGNQAEPSSTVSLARAEHDTSDDDMYVQADWTAGDLTDDGIWLVGRCGDSADLGSDTGVYLWVLVDGADLAVEIGGWGVAGTIATATLLSTSALATWRLELNGTTCRAYRNGVEVASGTSSLSPQPDGTRAGFEVDAQGGGATTAIDNFEYGDL